MTYDFSFERKSVAALLAASALLFVLVFFAGVTVGLGWNSKGEGRDARASSRDEAQRPAGQPAARPDSPSVAYARPREPALYDDPARGEYAGAYGPRAYGADSYDARQPEGAGAYEAQARNARPYDARDDYAAPQDVYAPRGYAPQAYAQRGTDAPDGARDAATPAPAATGRSEAARLSARNIDPDPQLVQESGADAASQRPASFPSYSVQVGAYLEEGEARGLAQQLEEKGYAPKVFSALDAEARKWFAVRIGSYASAREAGTAASNFSKQEGRRASVRPSGSL